ncbi:hypothetical protein P4B35_13920 [Pontiellaceae bacterium B12227]|nr:hypothetical protein [Pontiellaceae bacterium B12227]
MMKWIKSITVLTVLTATVLQSGAAVEKPVVMDEAMLSVTVSDFHGLMDEVGGVAAQVSPMMNGPMIKSMLGMQLGDPGLAGIPVGSGLSIVALDMTNIFAVVEVAEAQSASYISTAQSKGMMAKYVNGALILASSEAVLAKGAAKSDAVKNVLLAKRSPTLKIAMQPVAIMDRNKEAIDGFMQMLPALMGQSMMQQPGATLDSTASITKLLEGELRVLLSVAGQCDKVEVIVAPKDGSIKLSETFIPKAGTPLAALVNAPVKAEPNPKIQAGLLGDAAIKYDFHYANVDALGDFVSSEALKLVQEMNLEDINVDATIAAMQKWLDIYGGTGCEVVDFGEDGKMKVRYVTEISNEAKALDALKSMSTDMAPFLKLYEELGIPMALEFKENVREAAGTKVHQFVLKMDFTSMPAEQKEQMAGMGLDNMVYELAITDGKMFYSEPGAIEGLIQAVKAGKSTSKLQARTDYPAGGFYYFDLDMGAYMAFVAMMMPEVPEAAMMKQQMATMFDGVPPITSAGFKKDGCVQWGITIPGELLAKYGQMIMMAQMQQMQQGGGAGGM